MASEVHPLLPVFEAAARGDFPPADGAVVVLPAGSTPAVVGFTMRHYVLTDLSESEVRDHLDPTNFAAPMLPDFITWFAARQALQAGFTDIVLGAVAPGGGSRRLRQGARDELADHTRVARARHHRSGVEVWATPDKEQVAIFGSGVAGRLELSVEIASAQRGRGAASDLITDALLTREQGTAVFAQVSPGNVASLRAFLAAGFKPVCSEVVFAPSAGASVSA